MLTAAIQEALENSTEQPESPDVSFSREDLAAAALMVECARIDRALSEDELGMIVALVREHCGLDHETAECLVDVAQKKNDEVWHDWLFTSAIKQSHDDDGRRKLVEHLWGIAAVDGAFHDIEVKLVERIARELDVSDEFVAESRARAAAAAGLSETET